MRAELTGECFFVVTSVDSYGLKAHLTRVLNSKMPKTTDTVNCHYVTGARARVAQRVVDRNTGTHEWSGFFSGNFIGNRCQSSCRCNHVFSVSAVEVNPGNFSIDTHGEVSATTLFAHEAVSAVPTNTDALPLGPSDNVVAEGIDASGDFMTRHTRILKPGPQAFLDQRIAVADTTCLNFHANLSSGGLRCIALHQFPVSARSAYLSCFHFMTSLRSVDFKTLRLARPPLLTTQERK